MQEKDRNAIKEYKENNLTIKEVCDKYHICTKRFSKLLNENNIMKNDKRPIKYNLDIEYFKNINTGNKAYWLGFITGDGCIRKDGSLKLTLSKVDRHHLEQFKSDIKYNGPLLEYTSKSAYKNSKSLVELSIKRKEIYNDLINLGLNSNKSCNEKPIEFENYDFNKDFIRGLFDADGWISISKGKKCMYYEWGICSSFEMCSFIQEYLKSFNINTSVSKNNSKKDNDLFRIRTASKENIKKIFNLLYYQNNLLCLQRKYEKFLSL